MNHSNWLNLNEFERYILAALTRLHLSIESLRNHVVVNPNLGNGNFRFKFRKINRLELEALLIWVNVNFPYETWAYKLRESVLNSIKNRTEESLQLIRLLAISEDNPRARTLLVFQNKTNGEMRSFFGNFDLHLSRALRKTRAVPSDVSFIKKPKRKRGYNDHGSRDPDSAWKKARAFWEDAIEQREIEQLRESIEDTIQMISGFLE